MHKKVNSILAIILVFVAVKAYAFNMAVPCTGGGSALGYDLINGIVCATPMGGTTSHVLTFTNQAANVGVLALGTKTVTITGLTGVMANDVCTASLSSTQTLTVGLVLSGCRASANGQVDLIFSTPIAIGVSAGTVTVNIADIG